jgi:hypothetical protein
MSVLGLTMISKRQGSSPRCEKEMLPAASPMRGFVTVTENVTLPASGWLAPSGPAARSTGSGRVQAA